MSLFPPSRRLSFTGQRQDTVSGLYDFPAREYSIQGRWPSPDPAGSPLWGLAAVNPSNPQSWNRYAYVMNNPLALIDPLGLCGGEEDTPDLPCPNDNTVNVSAWKGGWNAWFWFFQMQQTTAATLPDQLTPPTQTSSGRTSGGPSLWTVSKNLNRCAAQLAKTKSLSALSNGRIPEVLGSNFFSDISTLATGGGGFDQGAGIAAEGTIQVAEHAGAQIAIGTVTTISTPVSATAGVYNPVSVGTASQSFGGTLAGRLTLGILKWGSIAKIGWDGAMYLAAEAACAAPAFQ